MTTPTFADATTAQTQTEIRDGYLASLAANGSTVGGLTISSPDRGLIEAEAAQMAFEQQTRATIAQASTITGAASLPGGADVPWTDADATWYQVDNGQGGTGRIPAQAAVWNVGLVVAPAAAPVTLQPGDQVQIQATDATIFQLSITAAVTINSGSSYKARVNFTARVPGVTGGSNASAIQGGQIITSGVAGLSVDASVLPTAFTAGRDAETSAALAQRCLASWSRLGAGWTIGSLNYLIPTFAPTVTRWRIDTSNPFGPGSIGIWLATATGPATGPSSMPGTECYEVLAGLTAPGVLPLGTGPVIVQPATQFNDVITATIIVDGTNPNVATQAAAAIALLNSMNILGPFGITVDLVVSLLTGASFVGPNGGPYMLSLITTGTGGTPTGSAQVPFGPWPGFAGVVNLTDIVSSQGSFSGGADLVPSANCLNATLVLTINTI